MALYAASSSSSSSASSSYKKHDVFISFRGEDTRQNLTSHLSVAFSRKQIKTFIDYGLPKGDDISSALKQAIEDSYVAMVVFSENYASSKWCLEELAHILECKRNQGQLVIPVFYKVEPTDVRNQTGPTYEQAFKEHETDLRHQHKVPKWRAALHEVANSAGFTWNSPDIRDDSELIQKVVDDLLRKLENRYPPTEKKGLVGIDKNCEHIESLLKEAQTIGIWGMGGIGKTTIAEVIFSKYSSHYEGCCFLENVRENSRKDDNGLDDLKCKLVSKLLGEKITEVSNFVKHRVSRMTVFIVLDDLSTPRQLESLALDGEHHCFGPGSRIIITTRDKHVLSKGVEETYEIEKLESQESLHLLRLNAFSEKSLPENWFEQQAKRAIAYCNGIPLALKVLGSFLRSKRKNEWDRALSKLEKIPHKDIQSVLKSSFEGLDDTEKDIFLDIACFLKGRDINHVKSLLDSFGFSAAIGLRVLEDKALITVYIGYVRMHDLIQEMGQEIVRQESIKELGKRSGLWDSKEIYDVLAYQEGSNNVEGINLDVTQIEDLHLPPNTFKKMRNLRFLRLYSASYKGSSHLHLSKGLKILPNKIVYLEWYRYPLKSLPSTFCPKKLVELRLNNSRVEKLWDGVLDLVNLKVIDLSYSEMLKELPDFSKALKLEEVTLQFCESLRCVHSSILSLHSLVELSLRGCSKLESLKSEIHLRCLKYLCAYFCTKLKEFSVTSEEMTWLELDCSGIEILHPSIGRLSKLETLRLPSSTLKNLPDELSCLKDLTELDLSGCEVVNNSKLQILLDGLHSLTMLSLDRCMNITEIPNNIQNLLELKYLSLSFCERLRSLSKLPPSLIGLCAAGCESLETVMGFRPVKQWKKNRRLSFENCVKLDDQSLHNIIEDAYSAFDDNRFSCSYICLPGSRVPEWFKYRTTQDSIIIDLLPTPELLGCALWVVQCAPADVDVYYEYASCSADFKSERWSWSIEDHHSQTTYLDNVHLRFLDFRENSKVTEGIANALSITKLRMSFTAAVSEKLSPHFPDIVIKEIGVWPIYASEYEAFVKELVRQRELKKHNKRPRDADEEEPLRKFKKLKL